MGHGFPTDDVVGEISEYRRSWGACDNRVLWYELLRSDGETIKSRFPLNLARRRRHALGKHAICDREVCE